MLTWGLIAILPKSHYNCIMSVHVNTLNVNVYIYKLTLVTKTPHTTTQYVSSDHHTRKHLQFPQLPNCHCDPLLSYCSNWPPSLPLHHFQLGGFRDAEVKFSHKTDSRSLISVFYEYIFKELQLLLSWFLRGEGLWSGNCMGMRPDTKEKHADSFSFLFCSDSCKTMQNAVSAC